MQPKSQPFIVLITLGGKKVERRSAIWKSFCLPLTK